MCTYVCYVGDVVHCLSNRWYICSTSCKERGGQGEGRREREKTKY